MKLAIIIPAYNEESLIEQCLTHVMTEVRRSGIDADVVVVDNASTDRTAEIAAGFEGVRVVHEPQKGLVFARAAGFAATSAEIVANVDADTMMPQGWIDRVMKEFARHPNLVALSGPYIYFDLALIPKVLITSHQLAAYVIYLVNRFVLRIGSVVQGGNFVILRSAWKKVGGFDKSITFYGEDTDVAVRLNQVGDVKWTFKLPMHSSGRRFTNEGFLRTSGYYILNYFAVTFAGKPATKDYTDIRPGTKKYTNARPD